MKEHDNILTIHLPNVDNGSKRSVLVHLSEDCISALDILARYYKKTRVAVIREMIEKGLKIVSDNYANETRKLAEIESIFKEMEFRAIQREEKANATPKRWEDSY